MIKLKPFYRVGVTETDLFVMSDFKVHRLTLDYQPLLKQLEVETDPANLSDDDLDRLKELNSIGVVSNTTGLHPELVNLFEIKSANELFVLDQLDHAKLSIKNFHQDVAWAEGLTSELKSYGLTITDKKPTLVVAVVERLNQPIEQFEQPTLLVKLGSYNITVGPLLTRWLTAEELSKLYESGKIGFEHESFLVDLPAPTRRLAVSLAAHEVLELALRAGAQRAITDIIGWSLPILRRTYWKVKHAQ